jgi:hypothetical protein
MLPVDVCQFQGSVPFSPYLFQLDQHPFQFRPTGCSDRATVHGWIRWGDLAQ